MSATFFPESSDVFTENQEGIENLLLPLAVIDFPSGGIRMPIVMPIEPCGGVVGDGTEEFHNEHCMVNWIGFELIDGRLKLLTDRRYFELPYVEQTGKRTDGLRQLKEYYESAWESYRQAKDFYRTKGFIPLSWEEPSDGANPAVMDATYPQADMPEGGNWAECYPGPELHIENRLEAGMEDEDLDEDELDDYMVEHALPLTKDGRKYQYVGCFCAPDYLDGVLCTEMLVFYDPQSNIQLVTFEWS